MNWKKTLLICLLILLVGGGITTLIFMTEPTAERGGATKETAMLVDVTTAERGTFRPTIVATGTVQPAEDVVLSPRVSGEIVRRSPVFVPGGFVRKGQLLLQIDRADYENALRLRQSDLKQAQTDLAIEMGRQDVARQDYQVLNDTLPKEKEALVLRQPQLQAAQARVEAARTAVRQAELALERTAIRAPFDAHILARNANVGSQVSPGDSLGRLVGVSEYWVVAHVPLADLRRLSWPGTGRAGASEVRIRNRTAWPDSTHRRGYLYRMVGALDNQTRLARVLVSVADPLSRQPDNTDAPTLMIGAFVEARIEAEPLEDVLRLHRDHVRENETVWVMEDERLHIREVDIAYRDARYAYIADGMHEEDLVVTTNLSTVVDGARLRRQENGDTTAVQEAMSAGR